MGSDAIDKLRSIGRVYGVWAPPLPVRNGFAFPRYFSQCSAMPAIQGAALQGDGPTISGKPELLRTPMGQGRSPIDPLHHSQIDTQPTFSHILHLCVRILGAE